jgi:hypothetical protein
MARLEAGSADGTGSLTPGDYRIIEKHIVRAEAELLRLEQGRSSWTGSNLLLRTMEAE